VARIALVNAPFRSHVAAMMRLADVLVRQGHELMVWAPEEWRATVEQLGARLEPSSPQMPGSGPGLAADLAAVTERVAEQLIPELYAHDVDIVVRDSQASWALVAAQYLGLPRIVSHPMFPIGSGRAAGGAQGAIERDRFEQSWLSIARRWGVELADVRGLYHDTTEPTLAFTTEEIVGARELPPTWRCVGPLLSAPPPPDPETDPPLVYASFGTAQNRRTSLFRLVIRALANQPVRLLVSTAGRRLGASELGPLPPNVVVRESVPVREVLASSTVHITHGGCNSVHESLVAGVPMVCLPQAFDQIPLSARVAELGAGVIAEQDPDAVGAAVLGLLGDDHARARSVALSAHLQEYDGEARVAAAVASCVESASRRR
jgi:MGT family glycosyltransferase